MTIKPVYIYEFNNKQLKNKLYIRATKKLKMKRVKMCRHPARKCFSFRNTRFTHAQEYWFHDNTTPRQVSYPGSVSVIELNSAVKQLWCGYIIEQCTPHFKCSN